MATVSELAARVLRRLGLSFVAVSDRAALGPTVNADTVAARALRAFGIPISEAERPASGAPLTKAEVARSVLERFGVNLIPIAPIDLGPVPITEIGKRALIRLEAIASDETAGGPDLDLAVQQVQAVHALMQAEGLTPFTDTTIPRYVSELYALMAAFMLASSFGRPVDVAGYEFARKELRSTLLGGPNAQAIAEREVAATSATLAQRGLAWWTDNAIPPAAAAEVVILTAARLAPTFGQPMDAATADGAEARIRQLGMVRGALQRAKDAVAGAQAELAASGLAPWGLDAIPAGAAEAMEALATQAVAADFGKASDPAAMEAAYARLRRQVYSGPIGQKIAEEYLWGVHAELDARGKVRWTMEDRPSQSDLVYELLAAYNMAPVVGVTPNPTDLIRAERTLSQIIAVPTSGERVRADYF